MKNNKGYTLVEILVVCAIISVAATATAMGHKTLKSADVTSAANEINTYMSSIRMNNMSKVTLKYIHIYKNNDKYYYYIDEIKKTTPADGHTYFGNANTAVFYRTSSESVIGNNGALTISYNRAGECKIYNKNGGELTTPLKSVTITNGSKQSIIRVLPAIGKNYIE